LEDVTQHAGNKVLMEVDDNISLPVGLECHLSSPQINQDVCEHMTIIFITSSQFSNVYSLHYQIEEFKKDKNNLV
jgi:hypothetical protein